MCPCECSRGGFCGGCGHAGCGARRQLPVSSQLALPHLRFNTTSRGTIYMPELRTHSHGALHLSESTSDAGAFVWLRASAPNTLDAPHTDRHEVVLHVSLNDLHHFVEQVEFLLTYHRNAEVKL